ncbi:MAG: SpoIIE family protein phosphatase [Spirochaetaceae bacterium]|jgi:sigma-B regulation protein RsbU (phosphoserine phosphatase)|nr:SpoIIE family protein phosphatase [Spirochaetaceae bacterium]
MQTEVRSYPNSIQKLARYFKAVRTEETIAGLADILDRDRSIPAVCVVDDLSRPLGIIRRDRLFLLLGKRFGWDLMGKRQVPEITEKAPVFPGAANIFTVSPFLSAAFKEEAPETGNSFMILTGPGGVFSGMLSFQDLSNYFVDMTNGDIAMAGLLQERFLASADEISGKGVEVNAWSLSAKGVGGDFYFIKDLGGDRFFAALCDVSGKGIAASLVVSMAWGFLRAYTITEDLAGLVTNLNSSIVSTFHMEKYLTGFFMIYDSGKRQLHFADMGHSHHVLLRGTSFHTLEKAGINIPVGIEADIKPALFRITIQPDDALLVYTDGITEQDNPEGEEFGNRRLFKLALQSCAEEKNFSALLAPALEDFRKNTPQRDDMTCLFFRF